MTLYEETVAALGTIAGRAATTEDVLFCERRPLTSLEAKFARADELAARLRAVEDEALRAVQRLVAAEEGYESALRAIAAAGGEASEWLSAVMLARALEALPASA